MNKKIFAVAVCVGAAAALDYGYHALSHVPLVAAVIAGRSPNCPYGLEPGGGAMKCADPNNPKSYLHKKNNSAVPAQTPPADGQTISPDGTEIITADGRHWYRRPDWMPSPQQDPSFCMRVSREMHSVSAMNRCVQIQNQEYSPSQADYENALRQISATLRQMNRTACIDEHRTWDELNGVCRR